MTPCMSQHSAGALVHQAQEQAMELARSDVAASTRGGDTRVGVTKATEDKGEGNATVGQGTCQNTFGTERGSERGSEHQQKHIA